MGQQRFNRLLGLQHNSVLPGTTAGLAPDAFTATK
jgi:hypothetical protein